MKSVEAIKLSPRLQILGEGADGFNGYIHYPLWKSPMFFQASWGGGWEHVSVSFKNRCPTWNEMCIVKDIFWGNNETVVQYHPSEEDYVDFYPTCLHLWRPIDTKLPVPPAAYVGPTRRTTNQ